MADLEQLWALSCPLVLLGDDITAKAPASRRNPGVRVMVLQPSSAFRNGLLELVFRCVFLLRLHGEIIFTFIETGAPHWADT